MAHIVPHWTFEGLEDVNVTVYTNCEELELFLNGESMGRKQIKKYGRGEDCPIALWSYRLCFRHPQTGAPVSFSCPPPAVFPWTAFDLPHLIAQSEDA